MKLKPLILLALVSSVLFGWSMIGPGKDWVLVKVKLGESIVMDTLHYRLRGAVMRGQGIISDSSMFSNSYTSDSPNGIMWYRAACSEFPLGTRVLITNAVNQYKVAAVISRRIPSQRSTRGMRLSLEPEAAEILHLSPSLVNQIRVQLLDSIGLKSFNPGDSLLSGIVSGLPPIHDSVSGYSFKKSARQLKGIASFYSLNLDGTLTATGEKFRNEKLTAASNNLPLNTWVRVTNQRNGNAVIVRINDRMHPRMAKKGRVVDLSYRAARALDFVKAGLTKVTVEVLQVLPKELKIIPPTPSENNKMAPDTLRKGSDSSMFPSTPMLGLATVYPVAYNGRKTQSGEVYRPGLMTAASNKVGIGTRLRVTSRDTGRWIEVWVNDRLPAATDKTIVIQVSGQAAKMLGFNPQKRHQVEVLPLFSPIKRK
ncbi:MAG: septal ring lytic transglycosylase RlpA family protein [Chitinophagaceae bacterium]|nr:septal ring lytic transglycosylase RlpA family protein [Chitinophagaceae bacterium]MCA6471579.1 septal ring lytic transglycosylase RlpA family protein [Chitinophagaceae bacterium]MCA6476716.1 septal ring lytic transglycosylase RlpA family protein [Chitinophagaceae bacterium]MCA6478983.1 septal ring lytic transglycosylase RlpA family protein [Chitinophagaceae bacterium]